MPDEKHATMYDDMDIPTPETFDDDYNTRSDAARAQTMTIEHHLTPKDLKKDPPKDLKGKALKHWKYQRYIKDYLRCVASVDDNVGRLLDYLDASGLAENTMVIYTSDQGFFLGEHGWFDKRFMYEECLRMPLAIRYPKTIKPGGVNQDLVLNLDFAPTFLSLAGVDVPGEMQGQSLMPLLGAQVPADWRTSIYYHYYEYPSWHMVKRHYGVRTQRYKLMHFYYDIDAWELYDLKKDPNELNNVYGSADYAEIEKKLKEELKRLRRQYGDSDSLTQAILKKNLADGKHKPR
jgi:arylsulfatase A-like enzyme